MGSVLGFRATHARLVTQVIIRAIGSVRRCLQRQDDPADLHDRKQFSCHSISKCLSVSD